MTSDYLQRSSAISRRIRVLLILLVTGCAIGQVIIDLSVENISCSIIAAITSALVFHLVLRGYAIRALPLPALLVFSFNFSTMSGALIAQTLSWKPIIFNLQVPLTTFVACALFQLSILVAFYLFLHSKSLGRLANFLNKDIIAPLGLMTMPAPAQLWLMGGVGIITLAMTASTGTGSAGSDVGAKVMAGLHYLAFAPFLIPILKSAFPEAKLESRPGSSAWLLVLYFGVVLLVAVVRNARGIFAISLTNQLMTIMMLFMLGQFSITKKIRNRIAVGFVALVFIGPALSDLAIAMVLVRGYRADVSSTELVDRTIDAFNNKAELNAFRDLIALDGNIKYNENYLDNVFLARFVTTKFVDITLSYSGFSRSERADYIIDATLEKILALAPTPVLRFAGIYIDKEAIKYSIGDMLLFIADGSPMGGFITASAVGHGMAMFGIFVFALAIPLYIFTFVLLQSLVRIKDGLISISPIILLQLTNVFYLTCGDGLHDPIAFALRGLPQSILFYWLLFRATRWFTSFTSDGRRRRAAIASGIHQRQINK